MTMGVVKSPSQGKSIDELIKNAHLTLSNSHIFNTNAFAFYKKDSVNNLVDNSDFDNYVKNLNLELFEVYLMPIIDVETNIIAGFECLTRVFNEFDDLGRCNKLKKNDIKFQEEYLFEFFDICN